MSSNTKLYKVSDIADVQTGPFGSQLHKSDYVEEGTPIVTVEHLGNKKLSSDTVPLVNDDDKKRLKKYCLSAGDVVFSRVGSVDRCSIVSEKENGWLFSGRCLRVRADKDYVDPDFLYYVFCMESMKEYIKGIAIGATMPSINTKILSEVPIELPDLNEQKAIAATLSCLDDKIELNNQINKALEEMAQAIFKSWFVDFEPFQDGEFEDSELGMIPKGWRVLHLKDISNFQNGYAFYKVGYSDSGVMVIDLGNVNLLGNFIKTNADKFIPTELFNQGKMKKYHVIKDDLVMIMTDRKSTMDLLGKTAKISSDDKYILNQRVGRIRANENINVNFLNTYLNSEDFLNELRSSP